MRQIDKCFNNMDSFIEKIHYCYDNMADLYWADTNKMKFKKLEGGK